MLKRWEVVFRGNSSSTPEAVRFWSRRAAVEWQEQVRLHAHLETEVRKIDRKAKKQRYLAAYEKWSGTPAS